ncbi:uncharacterized protein N7515_002768 [Penicillium bovifimosum]|uniref:Uncharacterized protein n=1 Tax=Penicillium bovifimosum TaxID=126998 RepID=A0A9W9HC58_9EURO|nr:uncharacterized protein N7515_002768 [Penicillium bovifimosum]KAJ5143981.1 hypothetical protein N7515_002768 [Penicillium bovifimosum]
MQTYLAQRQRILKRCHPLRMWSICLLTIGSSRPSPRLLFLAAPIVGLRRKPPMKVAKDSGLIYIAQNAFRHPASPFEPLFRSLYIEHPSYNMRQVDLITDRHNVRKLLSFINPKLSKPSREPFNIHVEITGKTAIFCRTETKTYAFIGRHVFRGHGHEFEKAFTTSQLAGSTGHHRVISYNLGGLKLIVRYETDAYVDGVAGQPHVDSANENLLDMMGNLSLSRPESHSHLPTESKLVIRKEGKQVPIESTLEIKTRVAHRYIGIQEVLPQLWVSQTPNLVRAYHQGGIFAPPEVEDVTREIAEWEENHANDIWCLVGLVKQIMKVVRENGGNAVIKYDGRSDGLTVWTREGSKMLPDDIYLKFGDETAPAQAIESDPRKITLKIGDTFHNVDISMIPYLSSFVSFQRRAQPQNINLIHGDIPLFEIALKGLESGYRQCFRSLRADIPRYKTLCETYDFLQVDVLAGQSIDNIFADLRAGKTDDELDYKRYRAVKGDKSRARDAAFRLLFLIIRGEFSDEKRDPDKVYNAVLFVVSYPGTFKQSTRIVLRSAFEERFVVSKKQRSQLDRWQMGVTTDSSGEENTTEDEYPEPYLSDDS